MQPMLSRHLPLITPRIEFTSLTFSSPSIVTPRIDFGECKSDLIAESESTRSNDDSAMLTDDDNNESEDSESASTGDDDTIGAPANSTRKIPKPAGEPGRPGSGGYNIETQLQGWTPDLIANVNKFVKLKADATLDTTKSYSKQKPSDITAICIQTKKNHPIVNKYQNYWPVRDMLKLHLKYTSEVYRKQGVAIRKMQKTCNN